MCWGLGRLRNEMSSITEVWTEAEFVGVIANEKVGSVGSFREILLCQHCMKV